MGEFKDMQTVVQGERRLKRQIMRKLIKEMIINWIKKILGKEHNKNKTFK